MRELLETRFRTDLDDVRLHHNFGGSAPAAFTEGLDVRFGTGAFRPQTAAGLRLLAHEVAHTVQQRDAAWGGASTHAEDGRETAESDAAQAAEAVLQGGHANVRMATSMRVARDGPAEHDLTAVAGPLAEVHAALEKKGEVAGVGDFPAAFRVLNGLSMADMLAVLSALEREHQVEVLAANLGAAEGVNRPRIEVAMSAVRLRAAQPAPVPESRTSELGTGYSELPPDQQEDVKRLLAGPAIAPPPPPPPPPPRPAPNLSTLGSGAFEPGLYMGANPTSDPQWVEHDIVNYRLSEAAPWTFTLIYGDRSELTIPLEQMMDTAPRGMMTFYRRQRATQRIVPFQADPLDPKVRKAGATAGEGWMQTLVTIGAPTFNKSVTPMIMNYLRDAQFIFLATGMLHVMEVQLMNPMMGGGARPGAGALGRGGAGAMARLGSSGGREALTFVEIGAGDLQASIRLARQGGVKVIAVDTAEPAASAVKELESLGGTFVKGEASKLAAGTADHVFQYFPWRIGGTGSHVAGGTWRLVEDAVKLLKSNGAAHFVTEDLATAQFLVREAGKKGLRTVLTETTAGIAAKGASGAGIPGFSASTGVFQVNIYM